MERRKLRLSSETLRVLNRTQAQRVVGGTDTGDLGGCLTRMTSDSISGTIDRTVTSTINGTSQDTGNTYTSCPWMSVTCELC
jgi:hypothetical protein